MAALEAALLVYFLRDVAIQNSQWGMILHVETPHLLNMLFFFVSPKTFRMGRI